jgi:hypothetical protein
MLGRCKAPAGMPVALKMNTYVKASKNNLVIFFLLLGHVSRSVFSETKAANSYKFKVNLTKLAMQRYVHTFLSFTYSCPETVLQTQSQCRARRTSLDVGFGENMIDHYLLISNHDRRN